MWKNRSCILLQNNNHYREKHNCNISLLKIQARAMFPNVFLHAAEMNGFRFFKSKSNPTISFQNPIQIRLTASFKIQILFKSKFFQS